MANSKETPTDWATLLIDGIDKPSPPAHACHLASAKYYVQQLTASARDIEAMRMADLRYRMSAGYYAHTIDAEMRHALSPAGMIERIEAEMWHALSPAGIIERIEERIEDAERDDIEDWLIENGVSTRTAQRCADADTVPEARRRAENAKAREKTLDGEAFSKKVVAKARELSKKKRPRHNWAALIAADLPPYTATHVRRVLKKANI